MDQARGCEVIVSRHVAERARARRSLVAFVQMMELGAGDHVDCSARILPQSRVGPFLPGPCLRAG